MPGKVYEGTTRFNSSILYALMGFELHRHIHLQNSWNSALKIYVFNCIYILLPKKRKIQVIFNSN